MQGGGEHHRQITEGSGRRREPSDLDVGVRRPKGGADRRGIQSSQGGGERYLNSELGGDGTREEEKHHRRIPESKGRRSSLNSELTLRRSARLQLRSPGW